MKYLSLFAACAVLVTTVSAHATPDGPEKAPAAEVQAALSSDVFNQFIDPPSLAFSSDKLTGAATRAKAAHAQLPVTKVDKAERYDLIIQAGHWPRKNGATGGTGEYVSEQEATALITLLLSEKLKGKNYKVALIGADDYAKPLNTRVFLSFHTDSSRSPCAIGPSVGYRAKTDGKGMHLIAAALAISMGYNVNEFMNDSYTANLSGYYAYNTMNSSDFEGLLEMAELSCPEQEQTLLTRMDVLAHNLSIAIEFALRPVTGK